jgi:hypothetical protein
VREILGSDAELEDHDATMSERLRPFEAHGTKPEDDADAVDEQDRRGTPDLEAEHARLVERIMQLQDAIRVLEKTPTGNRTGQAMLEHYRSNEKRLLRECRRLELELGRSAQQGELVLP